MSDQEIKSIFIMDCWGCSKMEAHPYTDNEDKERLTKALEQQGWRRRLFGPGAEPWFCSEECALHSHNALQAQEIWGNRFVSARKNRRLLLAFLFALPFIICGIVLMSAR